MNNLIRQIFSKKRGFIPQINDWENVIGSSLVLGVGSIENNSEAPTWSNGATFSFSNPADFELSFKYAETNATGSYLMAGLSIQAGSEDPHFSSIDYAVFIHNGVNFRVYENGIDTGLYLSNSVSFGDDISIKKINNVITYYLNNTLLYTSNVISNTDLVFDCAFSRRGHIDSIKINKI